MKSALQAVCIAIALASSACQSSTPENPSDWIGRRFSEVRPQMGTVVLTCGRGDDVEIVFLCRCSTDQHVITVSKGPAKPPVALWPHSEEADWLIGCSTPNEFFGVCEAIRYRVYVRRDETVLEVVDLSRDVVFGCLDDSP